MSALSHEPSRPEPSHHAMEQAAEWFALLRSGDASQKDTARWQQWLGAEAEHRQAWRYVEMVARNFEPIQATPDPRQTSNTLLAANSRMLQRRRTLTNIAALAGVGLLSWASYRNTPLPGMAVAWFADYRTSTGERREVLLADGTHVWLNAGTALNAEYGAELRRLHMLAGEILVDTAKDAGREFVVDTPHGRLRALGTRFTVRLQDKASTFLAVYEGAVEIRNEAGALQTVGAGQQIGFAADAIGSLADADPAREAWVRGILVAHDIPLSEVLRELDRHHRGHLGISPEVADLRVFGSFPLNDIDRTLAMLESALPVRVQRTLPWWVSIEPK